jgi:hypothetical protein
MRQAHHHRQPQQKVQARSELRMTDEKKKYKEQRSVALMQL